ncbi:phosphoribosylformylglycinamidine synthase subunit PurL [Kineococcus gynurae]|uniref:Phosphoribosylformylglycinamidine synthase subunit PurL n=1 Tax=Kineococcus gynurae TaxID=452979 RepID=A0ABV5LS12_9ACTN
MSTTTPTSLDTVERAVQTPEQEQPWAELGLKADEYQRIREILGRRPTGAELAMYSVMWSEHCSYKSSKVHLRTFGNHLTEEMKQHLMVGIGENAGVVDIGNGWAVTFKVESHNHPSYIEPYQGAATGVGGIIRDIMAMGARPIAVMDSLRFGAIDHPDTARVVPGVVSGVGGYGNCIGLPNIGGEVVFDPSYQGNPLVNALCVGALKHEDLHLANARGVGNLVVLFGARTGGDGIGGVSVLASETFDDEGPTKRPAVQVGDPFAEKILIECCLELFHAGLVEGIQDLGGAGLSCATSELASAGDGGMLVHLDRVPLRDPSLRAEEILMSESQERMMAVVTPANIDAFLAVTAKWDVETAVLGEVTDGEHLVVQWHGETVVDVPPRTVAHDGPVYQRPFARPESQDALQADVPTAQRLARPDGADALRATLLRMVASPNLCSRAWVTDQYDRYVMGGTALATPDDAGVVRVDEETGLGVALSLDGNGRYTKLDPRTGAQLSLAEAYRNVAAAGAKPLAVTDCLNFGSPEDSGVMWQFAEAVQGLAVACEQLGVPVTGGNVSLYNQTGDRGLDSAVLPTPVIGVLGVLDDVTRRTPSGWRESGQNIYLLGTTAEEFGGSEWAWAEHGHLGGLPPKLDLEREKLLADILVQSSRDGLVDAAHDLSDGGLAQGLVESGLRFGVGARVWLGELCDRDGVDVFTALFAESAGRAIVSVPREEEVRFTDMCTARGLPHVRIGVTDDAAGGPAQLEVQELFSVPLDELRAAHTATLPRHFAH